MKTGILLIVLSVCISMSLCGRIKVHINSRSHSRVHTSHKTKKRIFVNRRLATVDNMNRMNRFRKEVTVNMTILKKSQDFLDK